MTPDVWLILLSTLLTTAGYVLWVAEGPQRVRRLFGILAVVTFILSVVIHDVIAARQVTSEDIDGAPRTHQSRSGEPDATAS